MNYHDAHLQPFQESEVFSRGRPNLPELSSKKTILDYVTSRSSLLLERFTPGYDAWLTKSAPWDEYPEYQKAKEVIRAIVPTNDPAERMCATAKRYKVYFITFLVMPPKLPML